MTPRRNPYLWLDAIMLIAFVLATWGLIVLTNYTPPPSIGDYHADTFAR